VLLRLFKLPSTLRGYMWRALIHKRIQILHRRICKRHNERKQKANECQMGSARNFRRYFVHSCASVIVGMGPTCEREC
jgi:hypothetical protein